MFTHFTILQAQKIALPFSPKVSSILFTKIVLLDNAKSKTSSVLDD